MAEDAVRWTLNSLGFLPGGLPIRCAGHPSAALSMRRWRARDLLHGECLHELQYWIKLLVRAGDRVCARESGDILVLLPGMPADRLTVRIRAIIAAANAASRISDLPALRWGVAAFPRDGASPETLLGVASAKAGRSRGCD
jgi:hypothetical protein